VKIAGLSFPFDHNYEATILDELPGRPQERIEYFNRKGRVTGGDGMIVQVSPKAATPWIGVFAFGYDSPKAATAVLSCPDEKQLCIVSRGLGYLVFVDMPERWEFIPSFPILNVFVAVKERLIVVSNFTEITAIGERGKRWKADGLCRDDLQILAIDNGTVVAQGSDIVDGRLVRFRVNLETGLAARG
jgi:hypothetical protein